MINEKAAKKLCQKCSLLGIDSALQLFQLNDNDAILMCKNADCTFMSSTQWDSLVVDRGISSLRSYVSKKKSYSSAKSHKSCKSAPLPSRSEIPSRPSTPATEPISSDIDSKSLTNLYSSDSNSSSASVSQRDFVEERKTLVPIAPFLSGHAHTFSSFETQKLRKQVDTASSSLLPFPDSCITGPEANAFTPFEDIVFHQSRKRPSSDCDTLSSSGEPVDSIIPAVCDENFSAVADTGKKIRKVVVSKETWRKIVGGSHHIKII